jgi:hypothetical protein
MDPIRRKLDRGREKFEQKWRKTLGRGVSAAVDTRTSPVGGDTPVHRSSLAGEPAMDQDDDNMSIAESSQVVWHSALEPDAGPSQLNTDVPVTDRASDVESSESINMHAVKRTNIQGI